MAKQLFCLEVFGIIVRNAMQTNCSSAGQKNATPGEVFLVVGSWQPT